MCSLHNVNQKFCPVCIVAFSLLCLSGCYCLFLFAFSGDETSKALSSTINVAMVVATAAAAWSAALAVNESVKARTQQREQDKVSLWRSLTKEFDNEMQSKRSACGKEVKSGGSSPMLRASYGAVMDYFETVAFLMREGRIPEKLTEHTFWHSFDAYFRASKVSIEAERVQDNSIYEDVFWLHNRWGSDPSLNEGKDLKEFFEDEANLGAG